MTTYPIPCPYCDHGQVEQSRDEWHSPARPHVTVEWTETCKDCDGEGNYTPGCGCCDKHDAVRDSLGGEPLCEECYFDDLALGPVESTRGYRHELAVRIASHAANGFRLDADLVERFRRADAAFKAAIRMALRDAA